MMEKRYLAKMYLYLLCFIFFTLLLVAWIYIILTGKDNMGIVSFILLILFLLIGIILCLVYADENYQMYKKLNYAKKNDINSYNKMAMELEKKRIEQKNKIEMEHAKKQKQKDLEIRKQEQERAAIKNKVERLKKEGKVCCPRCCSESISAGTRGYTITTGFIGSGSVRCICMNCGLKWKPKR